MIGIILILSLQTSAVLFSSFFLRKTNSIWGFKWFIFWPNYIHPCYQQAFGPSFTRITFAAKECASFLFYMLVDHDIVRILCGNILCMCFPFIFDIFVKCLSALFSDRRLADHFGGKLHLGYMQIREKLTELQVLACQKLT